ncbi:hypothetical protein APHAL10511_007763 [Amanita phalloides]|nr:hypothetical protein APHAL10511_007763 [Amanita phalloides]
MAKNPLQNVKKTPVPASTQLGLGPEHLVPSGNPAVVPRNVKRKSVAFRDLDADDKDLPESLQNSSPPTTQDMITLDKSDEDDDLEEEMAEEELGEYEFHD